MSNKKDFNKKYDKTIEDLHVELVKMQEWVIQENKKIALIFEGRDAAGKGGTIKRIIEHLNPRHCRVVALAAPTEREKTQWYFQRYVNHLPAGGEIVIYDRSWYNRAGVEHVMEFCSEKEYINFTACCNRFHRVLGRLIYRECQIPRILHKFLGFLFLFFF